MGFEHRKGRWQRAPLYPRLAFVAWIALTGWIAWLVVVGIRIEHDIPPQDVAAQDGYKYRYLLPEPRLLEIRSNEKSRSRGSELLLYENGEPLGPAHARRRKIVRIGKGHYSHRNGRLFLSSSDNSDPRTNGRRYSWISRGHLPYGFLILSACLPFLAYGLHRLAPSLRLRQLYGRLLRSWRQVLTALLARTSTRPALIALLGLNGLVAGLVVIGVRVEYPIPAKQIFAQDGHSYGYKVPARLFRVRSDSELDPRRAESVLKEGGEPVGPNHGNHLSIANIGMGKYSHWDGNLYFSTSDNSDPRTNGRRYSLVSRGRLPYGFFVLSALPLLPFLILRLCRWMLFLFPRRGRVGGDSETASPARYFLRGSVWTAITMTSIAVTAYASHVVFWLGATLMAIGTIYVVANFVHTALALLGRDSRLVVSHPLAFTLLSIGVFAMLFEGTLGYLEGTVGVRSKEARRQAKTETPTATGSEPNPIPLLHPAAAAMKASRRGVLTLPDAWERRSVEIPGSLRSFYWHEVLHVSDQHGFRRSTPLPPRVGGVYRIMVIGDSMTFGTGVDAQWIYPTLIEERLAREYRVEVLNLGIPGRQSQDILLVLEKFLPELKPDLVVYGVCHNDFLPSGIGQYVKRYPFPMPESWKEFFLEKTRVAHFVDGAYDVVIRALGLRTDFFDDILRDFEGYQKRFGRDVKAMNEAVEALGLPAVVTMVLDQTPAISRKSYQVTLNAERLLEAAGMTVIETSDYYRRYDGENLMVSRWEGHPDEEAHAIFAGMVLDQIRSQIDLEPYRRAP